MSKTKAEQRAEARAKAWKWAKKTYGDKITRERYDQELDKAENEGEDAYQRENGSESEGVDGKERNQLDPDGVKGSSSIAEQDELAKEKNEVISPSLGKRPLMKPLFIAMAFMAFIACLAFTVFITNYPNKTKSCHNIKSSDTKLNEANCIINQPAHFFTPAERVGETVVEESFHPVIAEL